MFHKNIKFYKKNILYKYMNQLVKTHPEMKVYSFSSQYTNLDGDEKYNTKEIISNNGKSGKVTENNNGEVKKYDIPNLDNIIQPLNTRLLTIPELFTLPELKKIPIKKTEHLTTLNKILIVVILLLLVYIFRIRHYTN
tara:strand:- start:2565 stop:2978 length:414 start_codon:yes stop_codon:yes gene_type:complete